MNTLRWERGCEPGASLHGLLVGYSGEVCVAEIVERPADGDDGSNSEWLWRVLFDSHHEADGCEHTSEAARAAAEAAWAEWCASAALVPAGEADGWRPIAEAPRDGTPVLVAIAGGDFNAGTAQWDVDRGCWTYPCAVHGPGLDPTHWMPLPEPPGAAP